MNEQRGVWILDVPLYGADGHAIQFGSGEVTVTTSWGEVIVCKPMGAAFIEPDVWSEEYERGMDALREPA